MKEKFEIYVNENTETVFEIEICSDYGSMINVFVKTNGFAGQGPLYFNDLNIKEVIKCVSAMLDTLSGELILSDNESGEYLLKFAFCQDRLAISGIIGDYCDNRLYFKFFADQTVLSLLMNVLKMLV